MSRRHQRGSSIARFMQFMAGPVMACTRWPDSAAQPYGHNDTPSPGPRLSPAFRQLQQELAEEEARREVERERVRRQAAARQAARQASGTDRQSVSTISVSQPAITTAFTFTRQYGSTVHKRSMRERPARRHHRRQVMPARSV